MKKYFASLLVFAFLIPSCQKNVSYFKVTWLNDDETVLEIDSKVKKGSLPSYDSETPTKGSDEKFDYTFKSWDKDLVPVTEDVTYVATYEAQKRDSFIVVNHPSGFYNEAITLTMSAPSGYEIYYSLDNSDPDEHSTHYDAPIRIDDVSNRENKYSLKENISSLDVYYPSEKVDKCTLVKAIAINKDTNERSSISYFNYFVGFQNKSGYSNLPVITLNVNDDDLFDYDRGIYVTGRIYDESPHEGYPETYPANYHQKGKEWERNANFKFFENSKTLGLEQNIGIRIHGGWSRAFNQKSFNLYARKELSGSSTFDKQFFAGINAHSLMLRSGGYRDTDLTKVRDSLDQDMSENELFDIQRSMPAIVFLNGEYWGIYNLQERYSDYYVEEHHDIPRKNVLIIKNDEIDEGKETDYHFYEELVSFFQNNDFVESEKYEEAKGYIDMDEFASYMATQLYIGNIDWPGNNVRMYKDVKTENSKWHFMMYDTDDSSDIVPSKCAVDVDPFLKTSHWKSGPLESDCILGLMLSKLVLNSQFKVLFRTTFVRIGQNNFAPNKVNSYLDEKVNLLSTPMAKNYQRFVNNDYDETYYTTKVDIIRSFFDARYNYAISFLNEHIPE